MKQMLTIPSTSEGMLHADEFITTFCDDMHVSDYLATITVSVSNAVNNAVSHGNKNNPNKQVTIECGHCKGGVYVQVSDQGLGFDYEKYGDMPGNGNGIFLMKMLCDRLLFFKGGSVVRMEFEVDGVSQRETIRRGSVMKKYSQKQRIHA